MRRTALASLLPLVLSGIAAGQATRPNLFDPQRHMAVSEVRPGMKGYGLSVFSGIKIERFNVEVLSVLRNFNPKYDVLLVRMEGANLEHTGSIAGMSGSPIYLQDDQGRFRMAGAFAYGWPLTKDPIGGVQPIEYMLALPESKSDGSDGTISRAPSPEGAKPAEKRIHFSLLDIDPARYWQKLNNPAPALETTSLRPLATPLMAGGLSPSLMKEFGPAFRAMGMELLQAGAAAGGPSRDRAADDIKLEPGSVLAVSLMTGDLNLTAIGTCTEVLGNRAFGFGHSMNNEGVVSLPMATGRVNGIIPNMMTSFKIGEIARVNGTLGSDETVGVAGRIGPKAPTVPIDLHLTYTDGTIDRRYHFDACLHPRLTPMLSAIAVSSTLTGGRELPQYNTVDYDFDLEFESGQRIRLADASVNTTPAEMFYIFGMPLIAASENPFQRVPIKRVTGTLKVSTGARMAKLLTVNLPKEKYKAGETLKAYITYRPFRQEEAVVPVELDLPKDLPEGAYQLRIGGWESYLEDEQQTRPFRFTAETPTEMFDALRDVASIKRTHLYLRLVRQADGVAIGRTAMPSLPSSRRQVILESGWSNVTPFVSSTTKSFPTKYVIDGAAEFLITIEHDIRTAKKLEPKGAILPPSQPDPANGVPVPTPRRRDTGF